MLLNKEGKATAVQAALIRERVAGTVGTSKINEEATMESIRGILEKLPGRSVASNLKFIIILVAKASLNFDTPKVA